MVKGLQSFWQMSGPDFTHFWNNAPSFGLQVSVFYLSVNVHQLFSGDMESKIGGGCSMFQLRPWFAGKEGWL